MPKKSNNKPKVVITEQIVRKAPKKKKAAKQGKPKVTVIGKALRTGGEIAGGLFGQGKLGKMIGAGVSRIFGQGDYSVNRPIRNSLMTGPPSFSPLTSGFRIRHREYIRDVSSSVNFASTSYAINPGMNELFPWLSSIAVNFEEYKIHGMVVYLNTLSGVAIASTNTALGLWGAVTQYDPTEPDFTNKQQAENYVGCQTTVPSSSLMHGIECVPNSNLLNKMYVRTGEIPSGEDLKFYDWGKLQVFTQGSQAVNTIGEMWVSYDIEFTKPRLPTGGSNVVYSDKYYITGATPSFPIGQNLSPQTGSNLGTTVASDGRLSIPGSAPQGNYLVFCKWDTSATMTTGTPTVLTVGSVSGVNFFTGNSQNNTFAPQTGTLANRWMTIAFTFKKTSSDPGTLIISSGTTFVTASVDLFVTQLSTTLGLSTATAKFGKLESEWLHKLMNNPKLQRILEDPEILEEEKEDPRLVKANPIAEALEHHEDIIIRKPQSDTVAEVLENLTFTPHKEG